MQLVERDLEVVIRRLLGLRHRRRPSRSRAISTVTNNETNGQESCRSWFPFFLMDRPALRRFGKLAARSVDA
jgi:hypothetical protein